MLVVVDLLGVTLPDVALYCSLLTGSRLSGNKWE